MKKAIKRYLRQVKKNLCCPRSLKREFLLQLEDDILLFCEEQETNRFRIAERFGSPEETAAEFLAGVDPKRVSAFAYRRMLAAFLCLAAVLITAIPVVMLWSTDYCRTRQATVQAREAEIFVHPDGRECTHFFVKTNYRGADMYWEYSSCTGYLWLTIPPEDFDGTEPYAEDIYLHNNGTVEHWTFGQEHLAWIRVYDES